VGQGGQPLGDRPEPIKAQRVHGHAAVRRQGLNAVGLAVTVGVLMELGVPRPVPAVFNAPAVAHVLEQSLSAGSHAGDVVRGRQLSAKMSTRGAPASTSTRLLQLEDHLLRLWVCKA
jgi:hypothetical protein